jgi:hypothetical protein
MSGGSPCLLDGNIFYRLVKSWRGRSTARPSTDEVYILVCRSYPTHLPTMFYAFPLEIPLKVVTDGPYMLYAEKREDEGTRP